jgi:hypothetical protein
MKKSLLLLLILLQAKSWGQDLDKLIAAKVFDKIINGTKVGEIIAPAGTLVKVIEKNENKSLVSYRGSTSWVVNNVLESFQNAQRKEEATLLRSTKFDLIINGIKAGEVIAPLGAKVIVLQNDKDKVLVAFNLSTNWVNKNDLQSSLSASIEQTSTDLEKQLFIKNKLKEINVNNIRFENSNIEEAVIKLNEIIKNSCYGTNVYSFNIILKSSRSSQQLMGHKINLSLTDLPLGEVLKYVSSNVNMRVIIEPNDVVLVDLAGISPPSSIETVSPAVFYTRKESNLTNTAESQLIQAKLFNVSKEVFNRLTEMPLVWESYLKNHPYKLYPDKWVDSNGSHYLGEPTMSCIAIAARGIKFPPSGSMFHYRDNEQILYSRNTTYNNSKITELIDAAARGLSLPVAELPESKEVCGSSTSQSQSPPLNPTIKLTQSRPLQQISATPQPPSMQDPLELQKNISGLLDYLRITIWSWKNNDEITIDYKLKIKNLRYGWTAIYKESNGALSAIFIIDSVGSESALNIGDMLELEFSSNLKTFIGRKKRGNNTFGVINGRLLEKTSPSQIELLENANGSSNNQIVESQLFDISQEALSKIYTLPLEWVENIKQNPEYYKHHNQWDDPSGRPVSPSPDSIYFEARGITFSPPSSSNPGGSIISRGDKETDAFYSRNTIENNFKIVELIKIAKAGDQLPVAPLPESAPIAQMTSSASLPNIPIFTEATANQIEARFCAWMPPNRFLPFFQRESNLRSFPVIVEGRLNNIERRWDLRAIFDKLPVPTFYYEVQWLQNLGQFEESNKRLSALGYEILSQQIIQDPGGDVFQTVWVRKDQMTAARTCLQRLLP